VVVHTMNCGWNRGGLPLIPGAVVKVVCLRWSSQESPCSWRCFHWVARFARPGESMVSQPFPHRGLIFASRKIGARVRAPRDKACKRSLRAGITSLGPVLRPLKNRGRTSHSARQSLLTEIEGGS